MTGQSEVPSGGMVGSDRPLISCDSIHKSYGSFEVLRGISTSVRSGEVVCIVGPSGGGKSTFLRTLNGLEGIQSGSITVNGLRLPGNRKVLREIRREVGMVFQSFNLFGHMSVRDNITLAPITARGLSREEANERAERLLERVGIRDQVDKYPGQLSGGQQQRVAIARALAMEPLAMLFDEPTSALDPEMIKEVLDAIRELARTGMTMIIVTHEMSFAREIADRILFFADGLLQVDATPEPFFGCPTNERLRAFLSKLL
ncbi:amino acid ABC transporter ATP-binding protein [Chelatococcus asaccharovorans]|uniref:General L-amino acid transport system ATP-binding protein n=1 Tax=Chelatococcus asaccharovorans TaxID=28210 RepID=A0A2V3UUM8_9HYPH|nr:general L-amino acid transport system ATP-binding protein [Chelatococcus asaccharovorans]